LTEPARPSLESKLTGADRHQIFEQIALERLRSGSDTSKPVGFLPLPVRRTAISAVSITGLGVLWACLAQVPVQVNGVASIVPQVQVSSAIARSDGILSYQVSGMAPDQRSTAERRNDEALTKFWQQAVVNNSKSLDFSRLNKLSLAAMAPLKGQNLLMPESLSNNGQVDDLSFNSREYEKIYFGNSTIIARITNDAAMDELDALRRITSPRLQIDRSIIDDRRKRAVDFNKVTGLLSRQQQRTDQELKERENLYQRLEPVWKKGFVSTTQLLTEQAQINALRNQLLQLKREQLNSQFSINDQRQQADQSDLSSVQTTNQLQASLVSYMSRAFIIAPPSGAYILALAIRNGMQVRAGEELLTYSIEKPTLPEIIPVFVDAATSQQLAEGMQVLVTPKGISRAQYGGIPGIVDEVGKLPLPPEGLAAFAGGRTLASTIQQGVGTAYLVRVKLQQQEPTYCQQTLSLRCYRWSTKRRPPFPVRLGTLADVQITVQYRRPVEFVMPALRQALGLVVENR